MLKLPFLMEIFQYIYMQQSKGPMVEGKTNPSLRSTTNNHFTKIQGKVDLI